MKKNIVYLNETTSYQNVNVLKEEGSIKHNTFRVYFETILQTFEKKNRNKRTYTEKCGENIYNQAKELIDQDIFVGELDHPVSDKMERESKVELKTVSHKFTHVSLKNNVLYAKGYTTSTTEGRNLAGLLLDNVKVGFSLRAIGFNTKKASEIEIVDAPVMLITYDCVCTPSHADAVIQKINLQEAFDIICDNERCMLTSKLPVDLAIRFENYIKAKNNNLSNKSVDVLVESFFNRINEKF